MSERSILSDPLLSRAEQGQLSLTELETIRGQLENSQQLLLAELCENSQGLVELEAQLTDGIGDAFSLLHYALDELSDYLKSGQASQLRMARLLFEKGEEEYRSLRGRLKRIEMHASSSELPGGLWSRVREQADRSEEDLSWAEAEFSAHLQQCDLAFREALKCLPVDSAEAERKAQLLQLRLNTILS